MNCLLKNVCVGASRCSIFVILLFGATHSNAALIDQGTTTFDTATGYTWLDITESLGLSPQDIDNDVGGFLSSGWSIASGFAVDALFENAGVPAPASDLNILPDSSVTDLLLSLLGTGSLTVSGGAFGQAWAINSPGVYSAPNYTTEPATFSFTRGSSAISDPTSIRTVGVYLVRNDIAAVPTYGTLPLLLAGLACMAACRRRDDRWSRGDNFLSRIECGQHPERVFTSYGR